MRSSAESTAKRTAGGTCSRPTFWRLPCSPGAIRARTVPSENETVLSWLSTASSALGTGMNSQPTSSEKTGAAIIAATPA